VGGLPDQQPSGLLERMCPKPDLHHGLGLNREKRCGFLLTRDASSTASAGTRDQMSPYARRIFWPDIETVADGLGQREIADSRGVS
jgi:hypothetical protein